MNENFFAIESWDTGKLVYVRAEDIQTVFNCLSALMRVVALKIYPVGDTEDSDVAGTLPNDQEAIAQLFNDRLGVEVKPSPFQVEYEPEDNNRICIHISGLGSVLINRTGEGVIIDAYDQEGENNVATQALMDEEFGVETPD